MNGLILLAAVVILVCLLLNKVAVKLGMPMLLAFILLGMLFGTDGLFKIPFDNFELAEKICSFALIFIMFYGGFGTNWNAARPVALKSVLLSTLGVLLTALLTGLFCFFVLHFAFWESMLVGAVVSSTDAASVFSILRSKRLNLKDNTASMLELESGSNDPCSYMLTAIILSVMSGQVSGGELIWMIAAQFLLGALGGVLVAWVSGWVLDHVHFPTDGFDTIFVFSMALISYAGASALGGNGYLSAYIAGILLGNRSFQNKKAMIHFFDGLTGLMQMLIFFLLGLLSFPSQLPKVALSGLAISLFLTFVGRPLAVFTVLSPFRCPLNQKLLVSWAGLRGAASIVFAIMATVHPAYMKQDVFHIVFFIVLFSIALQGTLLSPVAQMLNTIDQNSDIMKTFSDYSEELPVQYLGLTVQSPHPWVGKKVREIELLPNLLLVLLVRNNEQVVPTGETVIQNGDEVILSALSSGNEAKGCLIERTVGRESTWCDKPLSEIRPGENKLVVLIRRGSQLILPDGSTVIREGDVLVLSRS
ncbi:potassium/proton antiporter [uncultured Ruthenibacterium sp.]|uniref:potassium/proton antiporter n=1 Tax=uncultured Ruthenibacterium sp. TaxID=1905347 RepID=UPI00349F03D7